MRGFKFVLLSTLSVLAVMTATAVSASPPPAVSFGLLKPQDKWKVGTVRAQGTAYCAMMNQFSRNVALAFARNPDGYGSIAINFQDSIFKQGTDYEVILQVDDGSVRKFSARASSPRAMVVQIGQDRRFYESLTGDGNLALSLPNANMTFALRKFSDTYPSLVDCADRLHHEGPKTAAMPVSPVEKTSLAGELTAQEKSLQVQGNADDPGKSIVWGAESQADPVAEENRTLRKAADELKQQLSRADSDYKAKLATTEDDTKKQLADLKNLLIVAKQEKEDLTAKLEAQDRQSKIVQMALSAKEQELLAITTRSADDGKKLADIQADLVNQKYDQSVVIDKLRTQLDEKVAQYAELQQKFEAQNGKSLADLAAQHDAVTELERKVADAEAQRQAAVDNAAAVRAELSDKEQKLAELTKQHSQTTDELTQKLTGAETDYQSKLAAAIAERDSLKEKYGTLMDENTSLRSGKERAEADFSDLKGKSADLENMLIAAEQKKQDLSNRLEASERQGKLLQAALAAKENELAEQKTVVAETIRKMPSTQAPGADNFSMPAVAKEAVTSEPVSAQDFLNKIVSFRKRGGVKEKASAMAEEGGAAKAGSAPFSDPPPASAAASASGIMVGSVTLDEILKKSGITAENMVMVAQTPDSVISQWTTGKVSGMYEQMAVSGDFNSQAQAYLARYHQDCGGDNIKIQTSAVEVRKVGMIAVADVECTAPSNSYASTFVFLRDAGVFSAILHTAYLSDRAEAQKARDALAETLKHQPGGSGASSNFRQGALKFNVSARAENASPASGNDLATVIVQ